MNVPTDPKDLARLLKENPEVLAELASAVRGGVGDALAGSSGDVAKLADAVSASYSAAVLSGREDLVAEIGHQLSALSYIHQVQMDRATRAAVVRALEIAARLFLSIVLKAL